MFLIKSCCFQKTELLHSALGKKSGQDLSWKNLYRYSCPMCIQITQLHTLSERFRSSAFVFDWCWQSIGSAAERLLLNTVKSGWNQIQLVAMLWTTQYCVIILVLVSE